MPAEAAKPLRILVVDDDKLDRLAVRRCLNQAGVDATVEETASAGETIQQLGEADYDCVLLDYYLPDDDGMQLLRDLRAMRPDLPVVIFTGRGDEDIAVEFLKSGATDYLPKASLTPERLTSAIRHAREVASAAAARNRAEHLLRLLSEAAEHILSAKDPDDLVRGLYDRIREPLGVDAFFNYMVASGGSGLELSAYAGVSEERASLVSHLEFGASVSGAVIADRKPFHATFLQESEESSVQMLKVLGLRACSCHPLLTEYELLGTLCFASLSKDRFREDELDFLRTVSHYATAAYERLRYIQQLREEERRKDEFLATLAHELRDPLAPLSNVLQLIGNANGREDILRQARDTMERQLGHLVQLVDDLLDMSRITRNRLELRKRRVELASVIRQAIDAARPMAASARHELQVQLPEGSVYVNADPVRLAQVFGNLLTNACKYTPPGGHIEVSAEVLDDEVVISVRDTGIGIARDQLAAVFEMFSQLPAARELSQGGLGIGLTLVQRLVSLHGGTVQVSSPGIGQGTEFVVRLPLLLGAAQGKPAARTDDAPEPCRRRILIVDDNRDSVASLAMLLQTAGHTTYEAYDGLEALEAADEFRPDVILLDIGLPKLNGLDVCRRIRASAQGKNVTIVAVSGWGQDEDRRKSHESGFDHHLVKPVDFQTLTRLLSELPRETPLSRSAG